MGCHKDSRLSSQNFVLLSEGVPLKRGRQSGVPPKIRYFVSIGSYSVKMVSDRYRLAAYHNMHALVTCFLDLLTSMTLKDLEAPKDGFW